MCSIECRRFAPGDYTLMHDVATHTGVDRGANNDAFVLDAYLFVTDQGVHARAWSRVNSAAPSQNGHHEWAAIFVM